MRCYAYSLWASQAELRQWAHLLGDDVIHWVADAARLDMGRGIPDDWKEQGAVFGPRGELRWWRHDQGYAAVLLSEEPVEGPPPLPGVWTAKEKQFALQDLRDRRIGPTFAQYPHSAKGGMMRARIYCRDGVPVFVSPRTLQGEE